MDSATETLCRVWHRECTRIDEYHEQGETRLTNVVRKEMIGWLDGFMDAMSAVGRNDLARDASELKHLWSWRADIVMLSRVEGLLNQQAVQP